MNRSLQLQVVLFVSAVLFGSSACVSPEAGKAAFWPQFRGPGSLAVASGQTIPDDFGPERHVIWKEPVGSGHSSPCIWGDRIFLTSSSSATHVDVTCHSRDNGRVIWTRGFELHGEEQMWHRDCSPATATTCTDGERVYAYFGGYGLIALDWGGSVVWERQYPMEENGYGTGTSPILDGNALYLVRDVAGFSSISCFDAKTGDERWTTPRPEASANYSSPFVWKRPDRTEIVVAGSSILTSYDAATGRSLWWITGLTRRACSSPVGSGDTLYYGGWSTFHVAPDRRLGTLFDPLVMPPKEVLGDAEAFVAHFDRNGDSAIQIDELPPSRLRAMFEFLDFDKDGGWETDEAQRFISFQTQPGKNVLVAIRAGGEGDITSTHVLWEKSKGIPYVASPLLYRDRLYYVKRGGFLTCLDARTGEPHYERARLGVGGEYYATPVGVGERILVGSERGTIFVVAASDEFEVVAKIELGEGILATPAIVENTLYLRTTDHLWAFKSTGD